MQIDRGKIKKHFPKDLFVFLCLENDNRTQSQPYYVITLIHYLGTDKYIIAI